MMQDPRAAELIGNLQDEMKEVKKRLAALEPKPEPKLPTEIGSHVRAGDGSREWVLVDQDSIPWKVIPSGRHEGISAVLTYCSTHGGFQVGRVVWEAE